MVKISTDIATIWFVNFWPDRLRNIHILYYHFWEWKKRGTKFLSISWILVKIILLMVAIAIAIQFLLPFISWCKDWIPIFLKAIWIEVVPLFGRPTIIIRQWEIFKKKRRKKRWWNINIRYFIMYVSNEIEKVVLSLKHHQDNDIF